MTRLTNGFRFLSGILLTVCLACALALTVCAEPAYAEPADVADAAALAAALPDVPEPDPIPVARLAADVSLSETIRTMGKVIVPEGHTLTVTAGGALTAGVEIRPGGAVVVEDGGLLSTTMGGDVSVSGSLSVQEGGQVRSDMGGRLMIRADGSLLLDGEFLCGCHGDQVWFASSGAVSGLGAVILYAPDPESECDLDAAQARVMEILGIGQIPNDGGVGVYIQKEVCSEAELVAFLGAERGVEGNCDLIALVSQSIYFSGRLSAMARIVVPPDRTLSLLPGSALQASVVIAPDGFVSVGDGAELSTTMGGDVIVAGGLGVSSGGQVRSTMGGSVVVEQSGRLYLDGTFFCGSVRPRRESVRIWFRNEGRVDGSGEIVVEPVFLEGTDGSFLPDAGTERLQAAGMVRAALGFAGPPFVFAAASDSAQMHLLSASSYVDGLFVEPGEGESGSRVILDSDLDLTGKKLRVSGADLVLGSGAALRMGALTDLTFASRSSRVVAEAAGAAGPDAPAGGTLIFNKLKLLSGSDKEAELLATKGIAFLSAAAYSLYPSQPVWLYVPDTGEARFNGRGLFATLELLVDGHLTLADGASVPYLELRGGLSADPGADVSVSSIRYCHACLPDRVFPGSYRTEFECVFDLNTGAPWYEDVLLCPSETGGRIDLAANGIPAAPEREGYTFGGWRFTSGWQGTALWTDKMAAELSAMALEEDGGKAFVRVPAAFPLTVQARWLKPSDLNGDGKTNGKDVVLLQRFLAGGYGASLTDDAADLNGDGKVNGKDVVLLQRFLAGGYGVELG